MGADVTEVLGEAGGGPIPTSAFTAEAGALGEVSAGSAEAAGPERFESTEYSGGANPDAAVGAGLGVVVDGSTGIGVGKAPPSGGIGGDVGGGLGVGPFSKICTREGGEFGSLPESGRNRFLKLSSNRFLTMSPNVSPYGSLYP
jgi:hypothetical protein